MVDAVAQHVHERVGQELHHAVVYADALGARVEAQKFFLFLREVPHHAGKTVEEGVERDDTQPEGGLVDEGDEPVGLRLERGKVVLLADEPVNFG